VRAEAAQCLEHGQGEQSRRHHHDLYFVTAEVRDGCAVGDLDLTYEAMELPADPGLTFLVSTAEPGSKTWDSLNLLATWSATLDQRNESEADRASDGARKA
jgi:hypothetical protein